MFRRLLLVGLLLRAAALPLAGTEDVQVWKTWSYGAVHGITSMYGIGGQPPVRGVVGWREVHTTVDYPPGTLAGLAVVGYAYRLLDPSFTDSRRLTAVIKLSIVVMDALACWLLWVLVRRLAGDQAARTVAACTALLVSTSALLPFAVRGALPNVVQGVGSLFRQDMLSATAANAWWIVTWLLRASHAVSDLGAWAAWTMTVRILGIRRFMELGYPNPRPIGMALVAGAAIWAFCRARTALTRGASPVLLLAAGAFTLHAYFMLAVQVHENHLFLALPLLAAAAASDVRFRPVAAAISVGMALNLLLFYGIGRDFRPLPRSATIIDATVLLAMAQVAIFMWHGRILQLATDQRSALEARLLSAARVDQPVRGDE